MPTNPIHGDALFGLPLWQPPAPALTSIVVLPASASVNNGSTQQFTAEARDQYGAPMVPQPTFSWATTGGGTINASGLFTATTEGSGFVVSASAAGRSGGATVAVTPSPYPSVIGTTRMADGTYRTTWNINWPGNRLENDILVLIFTEHQEKAPGLSGAGSWTFLASYDTSGPNIDGGGGRHTEAWWARVGAADAGSATKTTTITAIGGACGAVHLYLIRGGSLLSGANAVSATAINAASGGSGDNANSPNHTPSWGSTTTLWISAGSSDKGNPSAGPNGYSGFIQDNSYVNDWASITSAWRQNTVAAENPGAFQGTTGGGASNSWSAITIAVRPA